LEERRRIAGLGREEITTSKESGGYGTENTGPCKRQPPRKRGLSYRER